METRSITRGIDRVSTEITKGAEIKDGRIAEGQGESLSRVFISTYGCQMNVNDTERMYALLEMINYAPAATPEEADLILLNTCSVREKSVHKVFSEVGTYRKLKASNPHLRIGVGGCVGQQEKEKILKKSPLVDFVFGTDAIDDLPRIVQEHRISSFSENRRGGGWRSQDRSSSVYTSFSHQSPYHIETLVRDPGVSTFVNITKGCDNFCTFCVVPFTRGREKSRPLAHIIKDLQVLTQRGVKEVTLLGQNVNSYQSECGADFADLLRAAAQETDLLRLRFTTSHPKDFNEKLARVMAEGQKKICEYIHLPFQSGNSRVLSLMNRGYTREEYLERIGMIRSFLPQAVFSTDIIVGFPTETEEEFQDTLSMIDAVGVETIFAFKYSPRPFTKAAQFEGQISQEVKEDRLDRLFQFFDQWIQPRVQPYEGQILDVLVERFDQDRGNWIGRSTQNKTVIFSGEERERGEELEVGVQPAPSPRDSSSLIGALIPIRIQEAFSSVLHGRRVDGLEA